MEVAGSSSTNTSQHSRLTDDKHSAKTAQRRPALAVDCEQTRISHSPTNHSSVKVQPCERYLNEGDAEPFTIGRKRFSADAVPVVPPLVTSAKNKEAGIALSIGEKLRSLMLNGRRGSTSSLEKNLLNSGSDSNSTSQFNILSRQASPASDDDAQQFSSSSNTFGGRYWGRGPAAVVAPGNTYSDVEHNRNDRKRRCKVFSYHRRSIDTYKSKDDDT